MKHFGILTIFFVLISAVLSSESGEYQDLLKEKARIKEEIGSKPAHGQVIFAPQSVEPTVTPSTPSATKVAEVAEITSTPRAESKPKKPKNDDHHGEKKKEKDEYSDDEEEEKPITKKKKDTNRSNKKDKKSSAASESNESDDEVEDGVNGLPKRLFRPRFRADSSADKLKICSSTTLIITLSISLLAIYYI